MTRLVFFLLAVLPLAACGAHGMDDELDSLREHATAAAEELDRHAAGVDAAASLAALLDETRRHSDMMGEILDRMHDDLDAMTCGHQARRSMMSGVTDLHEHMTAHRADVESAPDLETARAVCGEHHDAMRAMMGAMDMMTGGMSR